MSNIKHLPKHDNGRPDLRYTINGEFIGLPKKMQVVRFCGDYVAYAPTVGDAAKLAVEHQESRWRSIVD